MSKRKRILKESKLAKQQLKYQERFDANLEEFRALMELIKDDRAYEICRWAYNEIVGLMKEIEK